MSDETTEAERPDYVKCIAHTHAQLIGNSWCGRDVRMEWAFRDVDHAASNGRQGGYLVACPACAAAAIAALGPPFNREDVEMLRLANEHFDTGTLADRIAALLPPEP